jgi:hypothetical protein
MNAVPANQEDPRVLTDEQIAILESRRYDTNPANWLTHEECDARLDELMTNGTPASSA